MVTMVGHESDLKSLVYNLILLDHDAIAAYDVAIKGLSDEGSRRTLSAFRDDHARHTENLAPFLAQFGGTVPQEGDFKQLLTSGKVAMGSLLGDKAILHAMREDDTNTAYGRAVEHDEASPELRQVLEQNLADERRHCAWILQALERS
jgi:hypothetical protein